MSREVIFTIVVVSVINFLSGRVWEYHTQDNYRKKYEKLYKEFNELKNKYAKELASKIKSEVSYK